jgi:hypothetical protein
MPEELPVERPVRSLEMLDSIHHTLVEVWESVVGNARQPMVFDVIVVAIGKPAGKQV